MEDFTTYCKDFAKIELNNLKGEELKVCSCDLAYRLTEAMNSDGTVTYSTNKAIEYLKEWWYDASDYFEYEKFNFGENIHNPFENPEAYMVCMIIEGVNILLSKCEVIDENWNDEVILTDEVIDELIEQIDNLDGDIEF